MDKKSKRKKVSDTLPPKPPETLQKIKWVLVHGSEHKKIIAIGVLIFILAWFTKNFVVKEFSFKSPLSTPELAALRNVEVKILYQARRSEKAAEMRQRLEAAGAKVILSQRYVLKSTEIPGVVYYEDPVRADAARALIKLFPKDLKGPQQNTWARSHFHADVYLFLP